MGRMNVKNGVCILWICCVPLMAYHTDERIAEHCLHTDSKLGFSIRKVERIARVTGKSMPDEQLPNPNRTDEVWNVGGTDLGVVWEMEQGKYGIAFGDTYGRGFKPHPKDPDPLDGSWLCNVLAFSEDGNLDDGLSLSNMATDQKGTAREIIYGGKNKSGEGNWTSIPTAAIRANGVDYIHYFNMKNWTGWETNYSGMYKSADDGLTWEKCKNISFSSDSPFGQVGYFKKEGYIYMIGTQTGRDSPARLARFREADIEIQEHYTYWNAASGEWIKGDESKASVIIDDQVGELSFIYNETYKKWVVVYFNKKRYNISLRAATEITGPWSEPYELVSGREYPRLYGSYFHPLSTKGDKLYFLMSMWVPYNVFLMRVELAEKESIKE